MARRYSTVSPSFLLLSVAKLPFFAPRTFCFREISASVAFGKFWVPNFSSGTFSRQVANRLVCLRGAPRNNGTRRKRSRRIVGTLRNCRPTALPSTRTKRRKPSLPSPNWPSRFCPTRKTITSKTAPTRFARRRGKPPLRRRSPRLLGDAVNDVEARQSPPSRFRTPRKFSPPPLTNRQNRIKFTRKKRFPSEPPFRRAERNACKRNFYEPRSFDRRRAEHVRARRRRSSVVWSRKAHGLRNPPKRNP